MASLLVSPNGVSQDLHKNEESLNNIDDSASNLTLEQAFREQSSHHVLNNTKLTKLFFDDKLKTGTWDEFKFRHLPRDNVIRRP